MMRSYLLLLLTNPTMSIDKWVDALRRIPLYAILSGFELVIPPALALFMTFSFDGGAVKRSTSATKRKVKGAETETEKRQKWWKSSCI